MSFDLTQKIKVVNPTSNIDELYGPYTSVANALTGVPVVLRQLGRTVGIIEGGTIKEYWFKNGTTDSDLVEKLAEATVINPVSATVSGIVNNTPLQELGGVDKLINGVRVGTSGSNISTNLVFGNNGALGAITTGYYNLAVGSRSLYRLTTGSGNIGVGSYSFESGSVTTEITGKHNIALGAASSGNLTSGNWNIGIGTASLSRILTGSGNIAIGYSSSNYTTTGNNNIIIGNYAGLIRSSEAGISNKLIIENRLPVLNPGSFYDKLPLGGVYTYDKSLIYGDFESRFVTINGKFSVAPAYMPVADATYTKQIVAKPDGTFGWENKTTGSSVISNKQRFTEDTIPAKTLTQTPKTNSVSVILNGLELDEQGGDYTVSGTTVTLANEPLTTDVIVIKYLY